MIAPTVVGLQRRDGKYLLRARLARLNDANPFLKTAAPSLVTQVHSAKREVESAEVAEGTFK